MIEHAALDVLIRCRLFTHQKAENFWWILRIIPSCLRATLRPPCTCVVFAIRTDALTLFRFTCEFCHTANEYRHDHALDVQPFLVSTKCSSCRKVNGLGGLSGELVTKSPPRKPRKNFGRVIFVQLPLRTRRENLNSD